MFISIFKIFYLTYSYIPIIRRILRTIIGGNRDKKEEIKLLDDLSDDLTLGILSNDKSLKEPLNNEQTQYPKN
jgi:hypothetical protein